MSKPATHQPTLCHPGHTGQGSNAVHLTLLCRLCGATYRTTHEHMIGRIVTCIGTAISRTRQPGLHYTLPGVEKKHNPSLAKLFGYAQGPWQRSGKQNPEKSRKSIDKPSVTE